MSHSLEKLVYSFKNERIAKGFMVSNKESYLIRRENKIFTYKSLSEEELANIIMFAGINEVMADAIDFYLTNNN